MTARSKIQMNYDLYCKHRKTGNAFYNEGKYKEAISIYSRCILHFDVRRTTQIQIKIQLGILMNNRAQCYIKLNKYDKALRDLKWILNTFKTEPVPQPNSEWTATPIHDSICHPNAIPLCTKALFRRAHIFLKLGNSTQSYGDYFSLISSPFHRVGFAKKMKMNLGILRHPSNSTIISCNQDTIKSNIFPLKSWTKIKTASFVEPLPSKATHSMISVGSELYVVNGRTHSSPFSDENQIFFMKIKIYKDGLDYYYKWKEIDFPNECRKAYNPYNNQVMVKTTIHEWSNHKLVLFGGFHPFKKLFVFCLKSKKWDILKLDMEEEMDLSLLNNDDDDDDEDDDYYDVDNHTAIIMNDKLFVYNFNHHGARNLFCYLDLKNKIWHQLLGKNSKSIPKSRYDQLMWYDAKNGKSGSIYIGFGVDSSTDSFNLNNVWKYDVFEDEWHLQPIYGNPPYKRGEIGSTSTKNGVVIFGGYTESLISLIPSNRNINPPQLIAGKWVYFGDCFKFINKTQKWKMIHCNVFPQHRASPAMCHMNKNLIILYGGYHGRNMNVTFNDLWILNMKNCKQTKEKRKCCTLCDKSSNEARLYRCRNCQISLYCSKFCQKKHWMQHKANCHI